MTRFLSIVFCCLAASLAAPAYAGTISFVPTATTVAVGEPISFQVFANGQGDPIVVSQFQLSYPTALLTPDSFTFAPGWTQTFDPGTDIMASGTVVQAGGYTATFKDSQLVGTLIFTAQKTGVATIALSKNNTYLFEGDSGGNFFNGSLSTAQVTVVPGAGGITSLNTAPPSSAAAAATTNPNTAPQILSTLGSVFPPWAVLLIVLALLAVWYVRHKVKKKRRRRW